MATRRRNASKRSVRRRVAKALKKYVRGNAGRFSIRKTKKRMKAKERASHSMGRALYDKGFTTRYISELKKRGNPPRIKGRKVKGGRAITLRNFTGTIVKKSDGTVGILGRGRRK